MSAPDALVVRDASGWLHMAAITNSPTAAATPARTLVSPGCRCAAGGGEAICGWRSCGAARCTAATSAGFGRPHCGQEVAMLETWRPQSGQVTSGIAKRWGTERNGDSHVHIRRIGRLRFRRLRCPGVLISLRPLAGDAQGHHRRSGRLRAGGIRISGRPGASGRRSGRGRTAEEVLGDR